MKSRKVCYFLKIIKVINRADEIGSAAHFNLLNRDDLFYITFDLMNTYSSGAIQQNMFRSWVAANNGATCDDIRTYTNILTLLSD